MEVVVGVDDGLLVRGGKERDKVVLAMVGTTVAAGADAAWSLACAADHWTEADGNGAEGRGRKAYAGRGRTDWAKETLRM